MSKFNSASSYFKRNNTQQLNITTKVSQKELKKNKKLEKNNANNSISNVSDNDFDKLMEENDNSKTTTINPNPNKTQIKISSYLDKIVESEILTQLVQEGIKGEDFVNRIKYENVSGSQLFKTILNKYFNKIVNAVIKANSLDKKSIKFYYNYYDFTNDRLGKPHGFLNEFMYEMCYDNSLYINKDESGNPITFKTLFGHKFHWELVGRNMMVISW